MDIGTLTGQISIEDQLSGQLTTITAHVRQFASHVDGLLGGVGVAATAAVAAVGSITGAIVALGMKGSVINGVEEAFDRLARQAGSTGEALIGGLEEGVQRTVDSMELMQATTRLLSSGIKLTADDMKVMGSVAREMGKATGTDAAQGLATLSSALLTGNVRALKRFSINIDLAESERKFAASIGVTRDQLNAAGQLEAHRIAMLDAMRTKLDVLGTSQLTFKERVQQATVAVGNWFDSLAKAVEKSSAVKTALATVFTAFQTTFGGPSQTFLQNIVGWIDQFANAVTRAVPVAVSTFQQVRTTIAEVAEWISDFNDRWQVTNTLIAGAKTVWSGIVGAFTLVKAAIEGIIKVWQSLPEWMQKTIQFAAEGAAVFGIYALAINAAATPFGILFGRLETCAKIAANLTGTIRNLTDITWLWQRPLAAARVAYAELVPLVMNSAVAMKASAIATQSVAMAKVFLLDKTVLLINSIGSFNKAIGVTAVVNAAAAASTRVVAAAKSFLAPIVLSLSINYQVLMARIGLTTTTMLASATAARVTTVAMTALGTAILGLQYILIPVIALWGSWEFGKWLGSFPAVQRALITLAERLHDISFGLIGISRDAADAKRAMMDAQNVWSAGGPAAGFFSIDPVIADLQKSTVEIAKAAGKSGEEINQFVAAAVTRFRELQDNGSTAMKTLEAQFAALTAAGNAPREAFKNLAQEILLLQGAGAQIPATLQPLLTMFPELTAAMDGAGAATTGYTNTAQKFEDKVQDLLKSVRDADQDLKVFENAFGRLTNATNLSFNAQEILVGGIAKLIEAHRPLTPTMQDVIDSHLARKEAMAAEDKFVLDAIGMSQGLVDQYARQGKSLADVALQYGVTTEAISRYLAEQQREFALQDRLAAFREAGADEARRNKERERQIRLSANKAIGDADKELADLRKSITHSTTDYQIQKIRQELAEQIAAHDQKKTLTADLKKTLEEIANVKIQKLIKDEELEQWAIFLDVTIKAKQNLKELSKAGLAVEREGLSNLSRAFADLSEITGGKLGKNLQSIAELFSLMNIGAQAGAQFGESWKKIGEIKLGGIKKEEIGQLIGSVTQLTASVLSMAAAWMKATDVAGAANRAFRGAMMGAEMGAQIGGAIGGEIGESIGRGIGALAGAIGGLLRKPAFEDIMKRVGHSWGVTISEELARTIADTAKEKFGGSRLAAEIFHIGDIIGEAGGLTAANVDKFTPKLRDVFVMLQTGVFDTAQATKILEENWARFAEAGTSATGALSAGLREVLQLALATGTATKTMVDYMKGMAASALTNLQPVFEATLKIFEPIGKRVEDSKKKLDDLAKKLDESTAKANALFIEGRPTGISADQAVSDLNEIIAAQDELTAALDEQQRAAASAKEELSDLGTIAVGTFAAAMAAGHSFAESLEIAQPALQNLRQTFTALGLDIEDAGLKTLLLQSDMLEKTPALIQGISALGANFTALANIGALNAQTFTAMERQGTRMYTRIQSEVAALGGDTRDALIPMQAYLHAAQKEAEQLQIALDPFTQMLIDQSRELGVWKDQGKSAMDKVADAIGTMTDKLEYFISVLTGIPRQITTEIDVKTPPSVPQPTSPELPFTPPERPPGGPIPAPATTQAPRLAAPQAQTLTQDVTTNFRVGTDAVTPALADIPSQVTTTVDVHTPVREVETFFGSIPKGVLVDVRLTPPEIDPTLEMLTGIPRAVETTVDLTVPDRQLHTFVDSLTQIPRTITTNVDLEQQELEQEIQTFFANLPQDIPIDLLVATPDAEIEQFLDAIPAQLKTELEVRVSSASQDARGVIESFPKEVLTKVELQPPTEAVSTTRDLLMSIPREIRAEMTVPDSQLLDDFINRIPERVFTDVEIVLPTQEVSDYRDQILNIPIARKSEIELNTPNQALRDLIESFDLIQPLYETEIGVRMPPPLPEDWLVLPETVYEPMVDTVAAEREIYAFLNSIPRDVETEIQVKTAEDAVERFVDSIPELISTSVHVTIPDEPIHQLLDSIPETITTRVEAEVPSVEIERFVESIPEEMATTISMMPDVQSFDDLRSRLGDFKMLTTEVEVSTPDAQIADFVESIPEQFLVDVDLTSPAREVDRVTDILMDVPAEIESEVVLDMPSDDLRVFFDAVKQDSAWQTFTRQGRGSQQAVDDAVQDLANRIKGDVPSSLDQALVRILAFRDQAKSAFGEVADEVDRLNFGSSPGGLKEIPLLLRQSTQSVLSFEAAATASMTAVKDRVDALSLESTFTAAIQSMSQAERDALMAGMAGFKGSVQAFLSQQALLYTVAQEGDQRLKTWLSGDTLALLESAQMSDVFVRAIVQMGHAEREALAAGMEGFSGTVTQFLAEQAALYRHAHEGDARLRTWLSAQTLETIEASEAGSQYLDVLVAQQRAIGEFNSEPFTRAIAAMSRAERQALEEGARGFGGSIEAFLSQQALLYAAVEEGDSRLQTWLSGDTLAMLEAAQTSDVFIKAIVRMSQAERQALADGMAGFKGTVTQFLAEQAALYQHAQEGDTRLKTWLSGQTLATIEASEAGIQYVMRLASQQRIAEQRALRGTEQVENIFTQAIERMSTSEREALYAGMQGFQGTAEAFLSQQAVLYHTAQEGDARLKTWLSGETLELLKSADAGNVFVKALVQMSDAELAALAAGMEGFKGTVTEFLAEQAALYQHAREGDVRFKTWLSGQTLATLEASDAGMRYVDVLRRQQEAGVGLQTVLDNMSFEGLRDVGGTEATLAGSIEKVNALFAKYGQGPATEDQLSALSAKFTATGAAFTSANVDQFLSSLERSYLVSNQAASSIAGNFQQINAAVDGGANAVNRFLYGSSPGGIVEIAPKMADASRAVKQFKVDTIASIPKKVTTTIEVLHTPMKALGGLFGLFGGIPKKIVTNVDVTPPPSGVIDAIVSKMRTVPKTIETDVEVTSPKSAVDSIIAKLRGIPETVETQINLETRGKSVVEAIVDKLRGIPKTVETQVDVETPERRVEDYTDVLMRVPKQLVTDVVFTVDESGRIVPPGGDQVLRPMVDTTIAERDLRRFVARWPDEITTNLHVETPEHAVSRFLASVPTDVTTAVDVEVPAIETVTEALRDIPSEVTTQVALDSNEAHRDIERLIHAEQDAQDQVRRVADVGDLAFALLADAAHGAAAEVDALNFGTSPGGLIDIPKLLNTATLAIRTFKVGAASIPKKVVTNIDVRYTPGKAINTALSSIPKKIYTDLDVRPTTAAQTAASLFRDVPERIETDLALQIPDRKLDDYTSTLMRIPPRITTEIDVQMPRGDWSTMPVPYPLPTPPAPPRVVAPTLPPNTQITDEQGNIRPRSDWTTMEAPSEQPPQIINNMPVLVIQREQLTLPEVREAMYRHMVEFGLQVAPLREGIEDLAREVARQEVARG